MTTIQGLDLTRVVFPDVMGIREAALFLNMSEQYVRTLLRKYAQGDHAGGLKGTKSEQGDWGIAKKDLEAFKVRAPATRGVRSDGKAFVIKVKVNDLPKVEAALKPLGIELAPRYSYKPKVKKAAAPSPQPK